LQVDLARQICDEILNSGLLPSQHLPEETLAARFEVSRTPVREALRLLAEYGIVDYRERSGFFVAKKPPRSKVSLFEDLGTTSDDLYRQLVSDHAGEKLDESWTEKEILLRYQVPRSVLSKTLVQMSTDGLIEKRKGHGWRFLPTLDTPEALNESYHFRILIECAGMLEETFRLDLAELARLKEAHLRLLDAAKPARTPSAFVSLNSRFHETLARLSGNRFIVQAVQQQNQLRRLEEHAAYFRLARLRDSCSEHVEIIEALERDDRVWAAALMRRHLSTAREATEIGGASAQGKVTDSTPEPAEQSAVKTTKASRQVRQAASDASASAPKAGKAKGQGSRKPAATV
jgi:DNA-binding GntR family transcriptional regulator